MPNEVCMSDEVQNFVDIYGIVSCKRNQQIYAYDDALGVYTPLDDIELSKLADKFIDTGQTELDWCDYNISVIKKYARTKAPYYEYMGRPGRIVFSNGTFHFKDMTLHKHSPKNRAITRLSVDYDETAECPTFERFISQMADGNKNLEKTLYEICGYVAVGSKKANKLVFLVSSGGSGKSVFIKVLELLAGKTYTSHLSIADINNTQRAFNRMKLLDSRLNVVHELDAKESLNSIFGANVKKVVSGEEISAEIKFGDTIEFLSKISMIVVASNHCPTFESMPSESIRRRFFILNITKTFPFKEQDPNLFKKIEAELSGIFNKALEYYQVLKDDNFVFASEEESRQFIDNQIIETFPMYQFVHENIISKPGHKLYNEQLRQRYIEWANDREVEVTADSKALMKMLANAIKSCHFPFTRGKDNGVRYLQGIDLKKE